MIKLENCEVMGWEAAIRELYKGKGVRWVYPNSYEAYISTHGKFLSCGTYPTEEQAREAVAITKIKLFEASVIAHGDNPSDVVESVEKGYFASPSGNIYNRHGDLMVGAVDHCGYRHTILNRKNRNVHRVIAETFIPNPDNLPCVNHKDGNKLNNSVDNLEWCTHSENTSHAYREGLEKKQTGEEHHNHKLTWADVHYIRDVYEKGNRIYGSAALGRLFGVDKSTVSAIVHNETWREQNDKN
jgi:hypothetical protein